MKTSVIRHRVADFLKGHPPFDVLSEQDLLNLAGSGRVKFHESEEYLFHQSDPKGNVVWIIQQGRVEVYEDSGAGEQLHDVLEEGDLLGLDRYAGDGSFLYSARTATDVIVYGVPADLFDSLVLRYPLVKHFLSAHVSLSGVFGFGRNSWLDAEPPSLEFMRARLTSLSINAAPSEVVSKVISARNSVVAILDENGRPVHLATPIELCAGSATAGVYTSPPALSGPLTTRAAVRAMLHAGSEELAITSGGTLDDPLEATLTASELALFCGHNPVRLIQSIRQAGSTTELVPLLRLAESLALAALAQPGDVEDCCRIGTAVVSALAEACIRLATDAGSSASPPVPYCWTLIGAAARGEIIRPRRPFVVLIYDDSAASLAPPDVAAFDDLAFRTAAFIDACNLPAQTWPDGLPSCIALSDWQCLYQEMIRHPLSHSLYLRREFFDSRFLSGDLSIYRKVQEDIAVQLSSHAMTVPLLANDTLSHLPPLTFYQGLVLDLDGAQRTSFDITASTVAPIADAARVFSLATERLTSAGTLERLKGAALDFPDGQAVLRAAADAFRTALYYRALAGNPRIEPSKLGKFDQRVLKTAFSSIQNLLEFTTNTLIPGA